MFIFVPPSQDLNNQYVDLGPALCMLSDKIGLLSACCIGFALLMLLRLLQ